MALVLESQVSGVPWGWEGEVGVHSSLWEGGGEQDSFLGNRHSGEGQTVILGKHLSSWGCFHHGLASCFPQFILVP